jgi:hypothetical protein
LFGTFKFYSPRLEHCDCIQRKTASFRPLSTLLTEPVAPELLYMEAKCALGQMTCDTFGKPYLPTLLAMKWD